MFEQAVRMKLRFEHKGLLSVEDLWDLHVNDLDSLFKALNAKARTQAEESLLDTPRPEDEITALQIDIVKHIVSVKLQEKEVAEKATERRARKQKLLEILEYKQDEQLRDMSSNKLQKLIDELEDV